MISVEIKINGQKIFEGCARRTGSLEPGIDLYKYMVWSPTVFPHRDEIKYAELNHKYSDGCIPLVKRIIDCYKKEIRETSAFKTVHSPCPYANPDCPICKKHD